MTLFIDPIPHVTFCDTLEALLQECQRLFEVTLTIMQTALSVGDRVVVVIIGALVVVIVVVVVLGVGVNVSLFSIKLP